MWKPPPRSTAGRASARRPPRLVSAAASCCRCALTVGRPAGAVALYGPDSNAFGGGSHDIAMLFAAQGGTALHNAALYRAARQMVHNLHTALESRAVIEQAKGILHAEFGVSPEEAFRLLSRRSHNTNRKVREIAAELVRGGIDPGQFRPSPRPGRAP